MRYEDYVTSAQVAGEFFEKGEYAKALDVFETLVASDISPIDKARMCHNVAVVLDKLGRGPEALQAYDRAIALEQPFSRGDSIERKAIFLADKNQLHAALALYDDLLAKPYATEDEKNRYRTAVAGLRQRLGG
jgi:tetratricopeptide (TPR) repeat protein